jgi:hypothetical protein
MPVKIEVGRLDTPHSVPEIEHLDALPQGLLLEHAGTDLVLTKKFFTVYSRRRPHGVQPGINSEPEGDDYQRKSYALLPAQLIRPPDPHEGIVDGYPPVRLDICPLPHLPQHRHQDVGTEQVFIRIFEHVMEFLYVRTIFKIILNGSGTVSTRLAGQEAIQCFSPPVQGSSGGVSVLALSNHEPPIGGKSVCAGW